MTQNSSICHDLTSAQIPSQIPIQSEESEEEETFDVEEMLAEQAAQQAARAGREPQPSSVPQPQPLRVNESGLDYPHCHLEAGIFKQFATGPDCICSSCNKVAGTSR